MLDKILLYDYCLSVYFAGPNKHDKYKVGTWYIFALKFFYLLMSFTMYILSVISYKLPEWGLVLLLFVLVYISHSRTEKWVNYRLNRMSVDRVYKRLEYKRVKAWTSLLLLSFAFALVFIIGILTFKGYMYR